MAHVRRRALRHARHSRLCRPQVRRRAATSTLTLRVQHSTISAPFRSALTLFSSGPPTFLFLLYCHVDCARRYPELEAFLFAHTDVQKVLDLLAPVSADASDDDPTAAADSHSPDATAEATAVGGANDALARTMTGHRKPAAAILLKSKGKDIKYALRGARLALLLFNSVESGPVQSSPHELWTG